MKPVERRNDPGAAHALTSEPRAAGFVTLPRDAVGLAEGTPGGRRSPAALRTCRFAGEGCAIPAIAPVSEYVELQVHV